MTAAFADDDLFHVLVSDDDMKRMNVDQLADAFRLSVIDASTLVWQTGMNGWRRLGSIADVEPEVEEELETAVLWAAPPPPPPVPAPRRRTTASFQTTAPYRAPVQQAPVWQEPEPAYYQPPQDSPASYFERPAYPSAPAYPTAAPAYPDPEPYYAPASYQAAAEPFAQPQLVSPVYSPALPAPDPYVLPRRRVDIPETIDFRRAPGSIRWGRWLMATLVLSLGVTVAYRQNFLRDGARKLGIEGTYLAAEHRATAFIGANSSPGVKRVLERLALLPGPNALPDAAPEPTPPSSKPAAAPILLGAAPMVAAPPCAAQPAEPQKAPETRSGPEPEVKTVSLNALPLLGRASSAKPTERSEEPSEPAVTRSRKSAAAQSDAEDDAEAAPVRQSKKKKARAERAERAAREESDEPAEKPVAKAKKEKPKASPLPPPPKDGNPLKAAMWSAVASDTKKLAARKQRD